jgi:hypothetical protein
MVSWPIEPGDIVSWDKLLLLRESRLIVSWCPMPEPDDIAVCAIVSCDILGELLCAKVGADSEMARIATLAVVGRRFSMRKLPQEWRTRDCMHPRLHPCSSRDPARLQWSTSFLRRRPPPKRGGQEGTLDL